MDRKYKLFCITFAIFLAISGCARRPPQPGLLPARTPVEELRIKVEQALRNPVVQDCFWGVAIQSLSTGEILYQQNGAKLLMPASNMKLITAAAALRRLGAHFTYETQVQTDGTITNGTLHGNLLVYGSGDPTISGRFNEGNPFRTFQNWSEQLKSRGIMKITGDVIGIDDAFDEDRYGFGWSWDDLPYYYATQVGALQFAENSVTVTLIAGQLDQLAIAEMEPDISYVSVVHDVRTTNGQTEPRVSWSYKPETKTIYATGTLPASGQDYGSFSIHNPGHYFATALKETLITNGIQVSGEAYRARDHLYQPPSTVRLLFTHRSPPLREILSVLLKASQNLYAETLLKTLGKGKFVTGLEQVRNSLSEMQIPVSNFILTDGSGLSRYNYVTPNGLLLLLQRMHRTPEFQNFYDALPVAGVDGTLRSRLKGTSAEKNVHAKTGSLSNVRSLSGYATTRDGEMLAFVLIANNFSAPPESVNRLQDEIVQHLTDFSRQDHRLHGRSQYRESVIDTCCKPLDSGVQ